MASPSNLKPTPLTPTNLKNTALSETAQAFLLVLTTEFKSITWRLGSRFKYRPTSTSTSTSTSTHSHTSAAPSGTIFIDQSSSTPMPYFALLTLHELGHALSNHQSYRTDIERLRIEAEVLNLSYLATKRGNETLTSLMTKNLPKMNSILTATGSIKNLAAKNVASRVFRPQTAVTTVLTATCSKPDTL